MFFQTIPNILILVSLVLIFVLVTRRLPEVHNAKNDFTVYNPNGIDSWYKRLAQFFLGYIQRSWNYVLHAKGVSGVERKSKLQNLRISSKKHEQKAGASTSDDRQELLSAKTMGKGEIAPKVSSTEKTEQHTRDKVQPVQTNASSGHSTAPIVTPTREIFSQEREDQLLLFVTREPNNPENYTSLAQYYLNTEKYQDALKIFDFLAKNYESAEHFGKLGYAQMQLRLYKQAVQSYTKSLELDPHHVSRLYNLALAQKALGSIPAAIVNMKKVVKMAPDNEKYQRTLDEMLRVK